MNGESVISVIIPIYNSEKFLPRCIESILKQTYKNFELILINDGSTDQSELICDEYSTKDNRIKFHQQNNKGVSSARNLGISNANGTWIVFVDADDYVENDFLQSLIVHEISEQSIVISGAKRINAEDGSFLWRNKFPNRTLSLRRKDEFFSNIVLHEILLYGTICGKLYNKNIIDKNSLRFDIKLSLHEDHLFYFQYLKYINTIILVDKTKYFYSNDNSLSLSTNQIHPFEELFSAYIKISEGFKSLLECWHINTEKDEGFKSIRSFIYSIFLHGIHSCYKMGYPKNSRIEALSYCNKSELNKWYKPPSIKGKVFKFVLWLFPTFLCDLLFRIAIKKHN